MAETSDTPTLGYRIRAWADRLRQGTVIVAVFITACYLCLAYFVPTDKYGLTMFLGFCTPWAALVFVYFQSLKISKIDTTNKRKSNVAGLVFIGVCSLFALMAFLNELFAIYSEFNKGFVSFIPTILFIVLFIASFFVFIQKNNKYHLNIIQSTGFVSSMALLGNGRFYVSPFMVNVKLEPLMNLNSVVRPFTTYIFFFAIMLYWLGQTVARWNQSYSGSSGNDATGANQTTDSIEHSNDAPITRAHHGVGQYHDYLLAGWRIITRAFLALCRAMMDVIQTIFSKSSATYIALAVASIWSMTIAKIGIFAPFEVHQSLWIGETQFDPYILNQLLFVELWIAFFVIGHALVKFEFGSDILEGIISTLLLSSIAVWGSQYVMHWFGDLLRNGWPKISDYFTMREGLILIFFLGLFFYVSMYESTHKNRRTLAFLPLLLSFAAAGYGIVGLGPSLVNSYTTRIDMSRNELQKQATRLQSTIPAASTKSVTLDPASEKPNLDWLNGRWGMFGDCNTTMVVTVEGARLKLVIGEKAELYPIKESTQDRISVEGIVFSRNENGGIFWKQGTDKILEMLPCKK